MKILIAGENIFGSVGGGQRFFSGVIKQHPEHEYYYFTSQPTSQFDLVPQNATPIELGNYFRTNEFMLDLMVWQGQRELSLVGKKYDVAYLMDMAASLRKYREFDIVEIPDYLPFAALLPEILRHHQISFSKVVLSMHGTLSMGLKDNWAKFESSGSLEAYEQLAYRVADVRYGFGKNYVRQWEAEQQIAANIINPLQIYGQVAEQAREEQQTIADASVEPIIPSLCFVGRQEKWKGPDLFLELCSRLPSKLFDKVLMWGPVVRLGNVDSAEAISQFARNRNLTPHFETIPPSEFLARLNRDPIVVCLPSRKDTFNLVALEALLSGCPAIVSNECGVCAFLDEAYPGIPYVKIDPNNILDSYVDVVDLLENYVERKRELSEFLKSVQPKAWGSSLAEVYEQRSTSDSAAADLLASSFGEYRRALDKLSPQLTESLAETVTRKFDSAFNSIDRALGATARAQISTSGKLIQLADSMRVKGDHFKLLSVIERERHFLSGCAFAGDRIRYYTLLAEAEHARGNELLYATYWIRVMRLSGRCNRAKLEEVQAILTRNNFAEEARVAALIFIGSADDQCEYLRKRKESHFQAPTIGRSEIVDFRDSKNVRVSIIVSVYRGADKIDTFLSGLERFTARSKSISEVIFVDSNSPDNTREVLLKRLSLAQQRGIRALYVRTEQRETIQRAWNRGIELSRGEYLAFLGVDEMKRPDAIEVLSDYLDEHPGADWIQGSAVVTEVNDRGSYLQDVMAYDRNFEFQEMHYLECCYISYVGALYRKSIHERVGMYDDSFRAAGDTEFKNRALPFIKVHSLPMTLGTFLNYPEERTTQSPTAELEDIRAWYLFRSEGGFRYGFGDNLNGLTRLIRASLNYKKSYMDVRCTDVELANAAIEFLARTNDEHFKLVEHLLPGIKHLLVAYRRYDQLTPMSQPFVSALTQIPSSFEHVWFEITKARELHQTFGLPATYLVTNDNRWHQHHLLWSSDSRNFVLDERIEVTDMAGCRDLSEIFSSCNSDSDFVDIGKAWASGKTTQIDGLVAEPSLDILVPVPSRTNLPRMDSLCRELVPLLSRGAKYSLALSGIGFEQKIVAPRSRVYLAGKLEDEKPLMAAAKVVVFPWFEEQPALLIASKALQCVASGKVCVLTNVVAAALRKSLGALELPSAVVVSDIKSLGSRVLELVESRELRVQLSAEMLTQSQRSGGPLWVGKNQDSSRVTQRSFFEWDEQVMMLNRIIRAAIDGDTEPLIEFRQSSSSSESDKLDYILSALILERSAPILTTDPGFKLRLQSVNLGALSPRAHN